MILEPTKSAEEIDRRLCALHDPELAEVLRAANPGLLGNEPDSYISPSAPYWQRRVGLIVLAGLFAISVGYGYSNYANNEHASPRTKSHAAAAVPVRAKHHQQVAVRRAAIKRHAAPATHAAAVVVPQRVAPVRPVSAPAADEALIRQARAQLLHERALAEQARAETAQARHQAELAMQAKAQAQARANAVALEQALAEARAQARAEAVARAQAQAQAEAAQAAQAEREQEWVVQNASGSGTKPGIGPPTDTHHVSTYPVPGGTLPGPGPIDPNCTPHRGSLFGSSLAGAALSQVRVGGTNLGAILRIVHP